LTFPAQPPQGIAFAVGLLGAGASMYVCARRTLDLTYDDAGWPGPKAWPATMGLICFFAASVFAQALKADLLGA
jgi:hypothetical protein